MARYRLRPAWHQWMYRSSLSFRGAYDAFAASIVHAYEPARRVLVAYKGPLVRLRRASDNAESDFTYIANGDLNVGAIAAWVGGASYVVTVYDQSPAGDDVTQAVAAYQPVFTATAQNGHAGMTFDGIDDLLQGAFTIGGVLSQPLNVYAVVTLTAAEVLRVANADICDGFEVDRRMVMLKTSARKYGMFVSATIAGSDLNANATLWAGRFDGAASSILANGSSVLTGDPGAQTVTGLTIGANYAGIVPLNAIISSLVVCAAHSDADRVLMQTAMNAYWAAY